MASGSPTFLRAPTMTFVSARVSGAPSGVAGRGASASTGRSTTADRQGGPNHD